MAKHKDKTVIVTGGGKGIGFGVCTAFAKEGANIVITGRTQATLDQAAEALRQYGVQVLPIVAEGGDEQAVQKVIDQAMAVFGRIDVLVNNAQASRSGVPLAEHTEADFDLAIQSGLYGTFHFMRAAFPHLKETKGRVINFASAAGISGKSGQASYAAAKEGIRGLSRVAATEWGPYGITVNVVCPLVMTEALAQWREQYPALYQKTIDDIPLGRFGDAEGDIGRVCVFLASEDASFISGETFQVQGGVGLRP